MDSAEDFQILSLFSDDVWGQLRDDGGLGADLESHQKESGFSFADPLSPGQESDISCEDPLPIWMSEKVALSAWLGDEEDIPMADFVAVSSTVETKSVSRKTEEFFKELLVDESEPHSPTSTRDQSVDDLLALSPANSLSPDTPYSSQDSPHPSSDSSSSSVVPSPVSYPTSSDLEAQALALLDTMGCMDLPSNLDALDSQLITVTLPLPDDRAGEERFASDSCPSPVSLHSLDDFTPSSSPLPTPAKRMKASPKRKNASPIEKKSRKRDQNKHAATRYRIKKKTESEVLHEELSGLENTNKSLKDKVEGMEREIKYLKDLLIEVRALKGQINIIQGDSVQ